ncbi:CAP domain [Pseudocohnilembus persalinus]|uniref:CAP domain n=1 Tax=Pseudocohnilembus persalinus TaxID=266149 RepID=A0A0V0Q7L3_PSEPJ|nr:CAP domain [Pseudocohnilembus persalinus]|eukprot:KRW98220.1 CAP domain [Pseudocohnilembus persalinus]
MDYNELKKIQLDFNYNDNNHEYIFDENKPEYQNNNNQQNTTQIYPESQINKIQTENQHIHDKVQIQKVESDEDESNDRAKLFLKAQQYRKQNNVYNNFDYDFNNQDEEKLLTPQEQIRQYRQKMSKNYNESKKFNNKPITIQNLQQQVSQEFVQNQLNEVNKPNNQVGFQKGQIISMNDLGKKSDYENQIILGKQALKFSNNFRKSQKLNELQWSQELFAIALEHSKNMAEGKVPFGHQGFNQRCQKCPFSQSAFCENVAYSNQNEEQISEQIVEGWINSKGHRKNLVSRANVCGIAAYKSDQNGNWYYTQLISYKN